MEPPEITSWEIPGSGDRVVLHNIHGTPLYDRTGPPIYGNTHWPDSTLRYAKGEPLGVLMCCHGFKGYKDYGFLPMLCDRAARAGLLAHRFNFSHSGMTNCIDTFEKPERFQIDTWSRQISDLKYLRVFGDCVYHPPAKDGWLVDDDSQQLPVIFFGHSRGGVTALLKTAHSYQPDFYGQFDDPGIVIPEGDAPTALITAAAPDYACNLDDLAKEQLRAEGRLLSPSGRTGQDLYVGRGWLDEIERDPELYDPILAAAYVKCPTLIIHGSGDTTVPVECAHNLHRAATPNSRLAIIEGASHTFDCPNPLPIDTPWEDVPAATRELIDLTVAFAVEQCEKARES